MLECDRTPTQRANNVLFIEWRMQANRGVVRQDNNKTCVFEMGKNLGKS